MKIGIATKLKNLIEKVKFTIIYTTISVTRMCPSCGQRKRQSNMLSFTIIFLLVLKSSKVLLTFKHTDTITKSIIYPN